MGVKLLEIIHIFYSFQMVKDVTWYKEKILTEISLGGLMVLVVIRALQFNISRTRVSTSDLIAI